MTKRRVALTPKDEWRDGVFIEGASGTHFEVVWNGHRDHPLGEEWPTPREYDPHKTRGRLHLKGERA